MESNKNVFNNNNNGYSNLGPTIPDEDYRQTEPDEAQSSKPGQTAIVDDKNLAVVGWLIGIEGDCKGKDFHLYYGDNVIGRGDSRPGRVCLYDPRIHGEGELALYYDPVNNEFSIRPKEGGNCLCYLNDRKSIQVSQVLSAYDCITLRERSIENQVISKLMFIPLCGERFTWKTGISERND